MFARRCLGIVALVLCLCVSSAALRADVIYLKDGRVIEGRVVAETTEEITIEIKCGALVSKLVVPRVDVARIEGQEALEQRYEKRAREAAPDDRQAQVELADWCAENGLLKRAARHYVAADELRPGDAYVRGRLADLGWQRDEQGRWVDEADLWRKRGYARWKGRWLPRQEVELHRERDALARHLEVIQRDFERHERTLARLEASIRNEETKLAAVRRRAREQRADLARNRVELIVARTRLDQARTRESTAVLPAQRRSAQAATKEAQEELQALKRKLAELEKQLEKSRKQELQLSEEKGYLTAQLAEGRKGHAHGTQVMAELEAKLRALDAQIAALGSSGPPDADGAAAPSSPSEATLRGEREELWHALRGKEQQLRDKRLEEARHRAAAQMSRRPAQRRRALQFAELLRQAAEQLEQERVALEAKLEEIESKLRPAGSGRRD